jgi:hypothetical protein
MITTAPLAADTLAITVAGEIDAADVEAAFDAICALPAGGPVHQLVTVRQDVAPHWGEALLAEWRRRADVMALIERAGRIAVVAPQTWVRAAARMEGWLLPGATYRTFRPEEAAIARSFVLGEAA